MVRKPLPGEPEVLARFAYQCGEALLYASELLELLRSFEDNTYSFLLPRFRANVRTRFVSRTSCTSVLDLHSCINKGVPEAAAEVAELIGYFDLSEPDRRRLRTRADQLSSARADWGLEGFSLGENEEGQQGSTEGPNAVRIVGLTGFFEPAASALADLCHRVEQRLNPPQVRDRVRVDLVKCKVTVDNETYTVSPGQAQLFYYLAEANGEGMSSTEIWEQIKIGVDFKASRFRSQLEGTELFRFLPAPDDTPDGKFRIVLPPLPD